MSASGFKPTQEPKFGDNVAGMPGRPKIGFLNNTINTPQMTKNIRVINRAEKGHLKGKPVFLSYAGQFFPEDIDINDESTWIKPGEDFIADKEVIIGNFGYIFEGKSYTNEAKEFLAHRFGGWEYQEDANPSARLASQTVVGPPVALPDLLFVQQDSRGKDTGETVSLFDLVIGKKVFMKKQNSK